jgi:hypothetical protein
MNQHIQSINQQNTKTHTLQTDMHSVETTRTL